MKIIILKNSEKKMKNQLKVNLKILKTLIFQIIKISLLISIQMLYQKNIFYPIFQVKIEKLLKIFQTFWKSTKIWFPGIMKKKL